MLECRGDGSPAPEYSWYKNGVLLSQDQLQSENIIQNSNDEHSTLDFIAPAELHEGFYHCEARNSLGLAKSSVTHVATSEVSPPEVIIYQVLWRKPSVNSF